MRRWALFLILLLSSLGWVGCAGGPQAGSPAPTQPAAGVPTEAPAADPVAAEPTPAGPTFTNPVFRTNFADPFLLQADGVWYAYATNGSGRNVQVATSSDLVKWKLGSDAMPGLAAWVKRSSADVWAPEVMEIGGQYVLYYTARDQKSGKQCVGTAVSAAPAGKFKDTRDAPLVCQTEEGGTIDPSPFRDGDKLYLFYKNDGNCCGIATYIYVQELAPDGLSLVGEPVRLVRNDVPWEGQVIEAPTMVRHGERYYLFYSANNYAGFEYAVGYATCESVTGPCQDAPENPILTSRMQEKPLVVGPGHQTVIETGGQTWLVYHAWDILASGIRSDNRFMWLDRLVWQDGKPVIAGPTTAPQPMP